VAVSEIRHMTGALRETSVQEGEWWRLLTCCFVHIGAIHLLINMWVLHSVGPMLERVFGSVRYALLFLVSGIAGSAAVVFYHPPDGPGVQLAGASGAICGLIGALLAWVWLNRSYIAQASEWLRNIFVNIVLLTLISLIPQVSGTAHLGGGLAGLALAVPLNFQRFGTSEQRWLGLVGTVALVVLLAGSIAYVASPQTELEHARFYYLPLILQADREGITTNTDIVLPFLKEVQKNGKVDQDKVKTTFAEIEKTQQKLEGIEEQLAQAREYSDDRINAAMETGKEYVKKWQLYFQTVKRLVNEQGEYVPREAGQWQSLNKRLGELQVELKESVLKPSRR
jgi:membrane associated rhomboid family serine protease